MTQKPTLLRISCTSLTSQQKRSLNMDKKEIMKPFKTVKTEYYEEVDMTVYPLRDSRRIKVVTTTENWCGSDKDPVTSTSFVYL